MSEMTQESPRGFASLAALASTISADPTIAPRAAPSAEPIAKPSDPGPSKSLSHQSNVPAGPGFWTGSRKTWAVIIAGICVVAYLNSGPQSSNYAPTPASRPTTPASPPPTPSRNTEPMRAPPIGENQALSLGEIKYCLTERIRIEGMQAIMDRSRDAHIRNFNFRVDDYNARCASYRYRQLDMTTARSEVDAMRPTLQTQVAEQVRAWR